MDEYPNSEEEFELMHGDELEILNQREDELDFTAGPKSRKSLDFSTPKAKSKSNASTEPQQGSSKDLENSFDRDFTALEFDQASGSKKRGIDDLFGDINDILLEEQYMNKPKKRKNASELQAEKLELIDRILEGRKMARDRENPNICIGSDVRSLSNIEHIKMNLSYRVPKFPFIGVTRHDGERIYVRMHSEEYEAEDIRRITSSNCLSGQMGIQFKDLWKKANAILNAKLSEINPQNGAEAQVEETTDTKLWVDMYKPRKYMELLSDESTNRTLLRWIKLWDKVVFNRKIKVKPIKPPDPIANPWFQKKELDETLDEHDRPKNKVVLLCGPPGLGKTTLAHMVARHAGYNVVEVNASDDRNVDSFKTALENATQMKSVLDRECRPNCLVFDEIDGAPTPAVEFLVKFINGLVQTKAKKGKKQKPNILKRPIICVCNDVYVPALRPLRQIAFILNFPPTSSIRLADRLKEIARYQNIKTDTYAMISLSEKTHNDIRSCLSVLHFFKTKNKPVTFLEIQKANIAQKDMQKGLFTVWQEIFEVKKPTPDVDEMTLEARMKNVLSNVMTFGDYDRLAQGVFENYPLQKGEEKEMVLAPVVAALEWFSYTDCLNRQIQESQNYSLLPYIPFGFVIWHYAFASYNRKKLVYPSAGYEANVKLNKRSAITTEVLRGLPSHLRSYVSADSLRLDILPNLAEILVPSIRAVNSNFFAAREKALINQVVNGMIDYNLTYIQERNTLGIYDFHLEPNIEEIVNYQGLTTNRTHMSYTNKQMIGREIDVEKMRRREQLLHTYAETSKDKKVADGKILEKEVKKKKEEEAKQMVEAKEDKVVPNHLRRLKIKAKFKPNEVEAKDFFGRPITVIVKPKFGDISATGSDIWFQYKEGYNNAVRRKIKYKSLL